MHPLRVVTFVLVAAVAFGQSRDDRWRSDLDFLALELPRRHPNLFAVTPRSEYERIVNALRAEIPSLSDLAIFVRMAEVAASVRDGHTSIPLFELPTAPVAVRWFEDGMWVIAAPWFKPELLGTRVLAVGGRPLAEAIDQLKRVVSYDNEQGVKVFTEIYFGRPAIWRALGITQSEDILSFTVEKPGGGREIIELERSGTGRVAAAGPSDGYMPLWRRNTGVPYWSAYFSTDRLLYVAYNLCREDPNRPMAGFTDEVFRILDTLPVDRFIVDLRNNPGGGDQVFNAFDDALSRRRSRFTGGVRLFTIIDRDTASSGMDAALRMRFKHGSLLFGESTSGKPDSFGNFESFNLPYSRIEVRVSKKWFDKPGDGDAVEPDVRVPEYARDYFSRHDPILAAVEAYDGRGPTAGSPFIVNAASFRPNPGVAPGSLVTLLGQFGPDPKVRFGSEDAAVAYADASQINVITPRHLPLGALDVEVSGAPFATTEIVEANPGIFVFNPTSLEQPGAILNSDGTLNARENPAGPDSIVQLFGTGGGSGQVRAYIGGQPARVLYSGGVEGFPGLWQVNLQVPVSQEARRQVPLYLVAGGVASNGVTLWVQ